MDVFRYDVIPVISVIGIVIGLYFSGISIYQFYLLSDEVYQEKIRRLKKKEWIEANPSKNITTKSVCSYIRIHFSYMTLKYFMGDKHYINVALFRIMVVIVLIVEVFAVQ